MCRERVEELEPSIRYCLHKIGKSNLQTSELLQIDEMEGPALDLFKAKLEVSLNILLVRCDHAVHSMVLHQGSYFITGVNSTSPL